MGIDYLYQTAVNIMKMALSRLVEGILHCRRRKLAILVIHVNVMPYIERKKKYG
jgi:hypothetical protein